MSELDPTREALRAHLLEHSVKTGDFVLKSGKRSKWFIDSKQTVCRPEAMVLVADSLLAIIPDEATAIGGLTMGRPGGIRDRWCRRYQGPPLEDLQRPQRG